jgi:hypothetical protein
LVILAKGTLPISGQIDRKFQCKLPTVARRKLLLADIARHAAKAYADEGHNADEVLARIQQLMNAEFSRPTDEPIQLG